MAQLTLSEKSALADNAQFRGRIFQAVFSKANYWKTQSAPSNLGDQKRHDYAEPFLKGGANSIDIFAITRYWLSNYNQDPPILDSNNQPIDNDILSSQGLDIVYDSLANVKDGDNLLPII